MFAIKRFCCIGVLFHTFTIGGGRNIVRFTEDSLYRGSLNRGSTE